ncbi:phosphoribosylglycinamide formyltransferase [Microthyrium microscopicum]|uniref:Phosphoribosylglycinamide formyltransferase n=1 Tax=Microthyrium microscopicum TaxID=703497 RepID=A0A6A6UG72_9PEZI|nr:phosphoribosylglycinamide formyltransferase [Microthyrium microscopicum]
MSFPTPTRITVLISGNGTNLQALIDAQPTTLSPARIVRVISNKKAAYGLERAKTANIPTAYHNIVAYRKKYEPKDETAARQAYDADLAALVLKDAPNLVVCAGFMHILSPQFLEPLAEKGVDIINLHPAKWGMFDGAGAIEKAHKAFMDGEITETGVMIHYVIAQVDRGELLVEEPIPLVHPDDDTVEALQEKIHSVEHKLIIRGTLMAIENLQRKQSS